ncbi:MAG: hypothetical protein FWD97_02830 [Defluviitaleaceae bacterium]|nr:hypothetical protein [Defluviitaleaceae bacterium]
MKKEGFFSANGKKPLSHCKRRNAGAAWGKLAYPKFLENWDGALFLDGREVWAGRCYFAWRSRGNRQRDGVLDDVSARATTDVDFVGELHGGGEMVFDVEGREFLVKGWRACYNPDGTFHHLSFDLLDV